MLDTEHSSQEAVDWNIRRSKEQEILRMLNTHVLLPWDQCIEVNTSTNFLGYRVNLQINNIR